MGCRKTNPFIYSETLVSDGRPRTIRYDDRNRRVVKAFTYDCCMEFTWTQDAVSINGPRGTEVHVQFEIR